MSHDDDLYDVTQPPISDELAEQLVSRSPGEPNAASLSRVDAVFEALRVSAEPSELAGKDAAIAAFRGAVVTHSAGPTTARTPHMLSKRLTTKVVATIGVVSLMSAGAAAASGTIPSPFASDRAEEVTAEHVPDVVRENVAKHVDDEADDDVAEDDVAEDDVAGEAPESDDDAQVTDDAAVAADAVGPDATGPAKYGLCTAYAARVGSAEEEVPTSIDVPVAFRNLSDAAEEAGQTVEEFCLDATPGRSDAAPGQDAESPSVTAPGRTAENPSVTAPGQAAENPSVTAPGRAADSPAVTAPGRPAENPSVTAPGRP